MNKLHEHLMQKLSWYKTWHENRTTPMAHWGTFIAIALILTNLSFSSIELASAKVSDDSLATTFYSHPRFSNRSGEIAQDHILVKFKDSINKEKRDKILAKNNLSEKSEISQIKVKLVNISPNDTPEEVVDRLNAQDKDSIEFAEVDKFVYPDYVPNDPQYSSNWHFAKMSAPSAWDIATGSPAVVIAILDTGTNCNHEDLVTRCVSGWNVYDNNSNTADVYGHGTATAGSAAAAGDNLLGVASPCYNCKIMPMRITDPNGSSNLSLVATAITYAADHGAKVANISFGPLGKVGETVSTAAQYFMSKGGVVVISAGNSTVNSTDPDDPYTIKVSGVDQNDILYGWSNYGTDIDLAAAGCVNTTNWGGGYAGTCGTSFSSPVVAGVAGLIFSKNLALTGAQVRNILKSNTNDIYTSGFDIYSGFGTPNMFAAVNAAGVGPIPDTTPPTSPTLSGSATSATSVNLSWTTSSDNVGVVGYDLYRNNSKLTTVAGTSYSDNSVSPSTSYTYYVKALDLAGNNSSPSNTISVTTPVLVTNITITSQQVSAKTGTTATITWTTNVNSTGVVSYGKSAGALTSSLVDNTPSKTHTMVLTNLTKLTTYYYQINASSSVGSSNVVGPVSSFKTSNK